MHIYAIGPTRGPLKIGYANNPKRRLASLVTGSPEPLHLKLVVNAGAEYRAVERRTHALLSDRRRFGEWFEVSVEEAEAFINEAIRQIREGLAAPAIIAEPPEPDPLDLLGVRARLGWMWGQGRSLTPTELGRACRLGDFDPGQSIRDYEAGKTKISGPLSALLELYLRGVLPPDGLDALRG